MPAGLKALKRNNPKEIIKSLNCEAIEFHATAKNARNGGRIWDLKIMEMKKDETGEMFLTTILEQDKVSEDEIYDIKEVYAEYYNLTVERMQIKL